MWLKCWGPSISRGASTDGFTAHISPSRVFVGLVGLQHIPLCLFVLTTIAHQDSIDRRGVGDVADIESTPGQCSYQFYNK
jgi:hypothetical protein